MKKRHYQTLIILIIFLYCNLFTIQEQKITARDNIKKILFTKKSGLLCIGSLALSSLLLYINTKNQEGHIPLFFGSQTLLLLFLLNKPLIYEPQKAIPLTTRGIAFCGSYIITDIIYSYYIKDSKNPYLYLLAIIPTVTYSLGLITEECLKYKKYIDNKRKSASDTLEE